MVKDAMGFIETQGFTAAIEAGDTMVKAANVIIYGYRTVGSGLTCVIVEGDVGAVQAAVEAGLKAANRTGQVVSSLVKPRPDPSIVEALSRFQGKGKALFHNMETQESKSTTKEELSTVSETDLSLTDNKRKTGKLTKD